MPSRSSLDDLIVEARACRNCAQVLPLGPRPVFQASPTARLLVASQAPGTKVHASGVPFSDRSGVQLRAWMGIDQATFYDADRVAILPMAFCYPGRRGSGDAPPPPVCAELWRSRFLERMPQIELTLLVGTYAQENVLGPGRMIDRVRHYAEYLPRYFPLPHPSWRSLVWSRNNPWFEEQVIPQLRAHVRQVLGAGKSPAENVTPGGV